MTTNTPPASPTIQSAQEVPVAGVIGATTDSMHAILPPDGGQSLPSLVDEELLRRYIEGVPPLAAYLQYKLHVFHSPELTEFVDALRANNNDPDCTIESYKGVTYLCLSYTAGGKDILMTYQITLSRGVHGGLYYKVNFHDYERRESPAGKGLSFDIRPANS